MHRIKNQGDKYIPCSLLFILNWARSHLPSNFPICRGAILSTPFHPNWLYFSLPIALCSVTSYPAFHSQKACGWSFQNTSLFLSRRRHAAKLRDSNACKAPGYKLWGCLSTWPERLENLASGCYREIVCRVEEGPRWGSESWGKTKKASHNFEGIG